MPPKKPGTKIVRRNRKITGRPERGQYIMGIPEPVGFAIVLVACIIAILFAFGVL